MAALQGLPAGPACTDACLIDLAHKNRTTRLRRYSPADAVSEVCSISGYPTEA
jgi:hypothetical protein